MLSRKMRMSALLMVICMALMLFVSSAYIAHEAGHICPGEACKVCETIARMEAVVRSFALLGVILPVLRALPVVFRALHTQDVSGSRADPTLVSWKVRLNN